MKIKLPTIVWITAIVLAACSAFYSVFGLSKLFSGAVIAVITVASILEISKIVVATYLHDYWNNSFRLLKMYLVFALACLMIITSLGVYGFLTSAYQDTIKEFKLKQNEITKIDVKIEAVNKQIQFLKQNGLDIQKRLQTAQDLKTNQDKTISTIYSSSTTKNTKLLEKSIKTADDLFNNTSNQLMENQLKVSAATDSLNSYEMKKLQLQTENQISEVGPLLYISKLFNVEMDSIVNLLVLLIVIVFDPLAVALIIAANKMKNEKIEQNNFSFTEKNSILDQSALVDSLENKNESAEKENILNEIEDINTLIENEEEIKNESNENNVQDHVEIKKAEKNLPKNIYGEPARIVNKGKAVSIL